MRWNRIGLDVCVLNHHLCLPIPPNVPRAIEPQQYDNNPYKDPSRQLNANGWLIGLRWVTIQNLENTKQITLYGAKEA